MIEIADSTAHRALAYVAAVERQGHRMSVSQLSEYVSRPTRRPGIPGKPAQPAHSVRTTAVDRAIADIFKNSVQPTVQSIASTINTVLDVRTEELEGTPAIPGVPDETVPDWLVRLGWITAADNVVSISELGRAVLAHLDQESLEDEIPVGIVLNRGDELAQGRVISHIASLGGCAIVDPYFSLESLFHIVYSTEAEEVLVGTRDRRKLAGIETTLPRLQTSRPFEIRKSDVFHDRFVIPKSGSVWFLGTSLSGLGRRLSIMVELADDALIRVIRREFRDAWDEAEPVVAAEQALLAEQSVGPATDA